jgi:hypothetical protein
MFSTTNFKLVPGRFGVSYNVDREVIGIPASASKLFLMFSTGFFWIV